MQISLLTFENQSFFSWTGGFLKQRRRCDVIWVGTESSFKPHLRPQVGVPQSLTKLTIGLVNLSRGCLKVSSSGALQTCIYGTSLLSPTETGPLMPWCLASSLLYVSHMCRHKMACKHSTKFWNEKKRRIHIGHWCCYKKSYFWHEFQFSLTHSLFKRNQIINGTRTWEPLVPPQYHGLSGSSW